MWSRNIIVLLISLSTACVVQTEPVEGLPCWDLDDDGVEDKAEDVNDDGSWDARDCAGQQGQTGPQGPSGPSPWVQNGNGDVYYTAGRVGIGTDTPSAVLRVSSNVGDFHGVLIDHIDAEDNFLGSNEYVGVTFRSDGSGAASWAQLSFAGSVTQSAYAIDAGRVNDLQGNPANLLLNPTGGYVGIGPGTAQVAPEVPLHVSACAQPQIAIERSGCPGAGKWSFGANGASGLAITDDTGVVSGTGPTRLAIDSAGNVGIGTNSPKGKLDITGGGLFLDHLGNQIYMHFAPDPPESVMRLERAEGAFRIDLEPGNKELFRVTDAGDASVLGDLHVSANVGVGTTTPAATLDVNGTARLARYASQPFPCDPAHDGTIALTGATKLCVCNGSAWLLAKDDNPCWP